MIPGNLNTPVDMHYCFSDFDWQSFNLKVLYVRFIVYISFHLIHFVLSAFLENTAKSNGSTQFLQSSSGDLH